MPDKDWRVTFEFTELASGRVNDTTFTLREHVDTPAGNLSGSTVADDVAGWMKTRAKAMTISTFSLTRVLVNRGGVWGPGEGDPAEAGEKSVAEACTLSDPGGDVLPHGVCARVTIRTDLASKRGTGRFRAPWPARASFLQGPDLWDVSKPYYANVQAFANDLLSGHDVTHDLITHHYSLRVHSRTDHTTRDAKTVVTRVQPSYLRSRLTSP